MTTSDAGVRRVFLTGATGFIGGAVVRALVDRGVREVRCLVRPNAPTSPFPPGIGLVPGTLEEPESYSNSLRGVDAVMHLAAKVGGGSKAEHQRINVDGTRSLLEASARAGVQRFVFVSSIAAGFEDRTAYHYAEAKRHAEQLVRASALDSLIVRPTFVMGSGSPTTGKIVSVATLPVLPIIGSGQVRVQPVDVDDVAAYLVAMLDEPSWPDHEVDLGGPDVVTFEELLRRVRAARLGRRGPAVHLPARSAIRALSWLERLVGGSLPVSAGPFATFLNDSTARPDTTVSSHVPRMKSLDRMLEDLAAHGR